MYIPSIKRGFPRNISMSLVIAILLVILLASTAMAQEQEILRSSLDQMKATQVWWDKLWINTFRPPPGLAGTDLTAYWIANVARFFIMICIIPWLYQVGTEFYLARTLPDIIKVFFRYFFFGVFALSLLANNAEMSRNLSLGIREIINNQANGLMAVQYEGLSMRSALSNQLLIRSQSDKAMAKAQECAALPRPSVVLSSPERPPADRQPPLSREENQAYDYLDCIRAFKTQVETDNAAMRATMCSGLNGIKCDIYDRWGRRLQNSVDQFSQLEWQRISNPTSFETQQRNGPPIFGQQPFSSLQDLLVGSAASAVLVPILNNIQWCFVSLLELALFLSGLSAPIFAATAIIPGQLNMFFGAWLIPFLTIGMMKIFYVLIIGTMAVIMSQNDSFLLSELRFPMMLGFFGPILAIAIPSLGAWGASKAFFGTTVNIAGAVGGMASSGISAMGFAISRSIDKNR